MSWRVIQKSRITGVEQEATSEFMTKEGAEAAVQTLWRSYVDAHYNHFVELRIEEIVYGEEAADEV